MEYTRLGKTGLTVSRICFGCMSYGDGKWREWTLGADEAREQALEAGVNFFDTADVYSIGVSEEITGRWLGEMAARDDIVLATKVNGPMGPGPNRRGLSRKHIIEACENSLRRLKMDYIDLYQIHRWDYATPIEETLDALDFWSGRARSAIWGPAAWPPGSFPRRCTRPRSTAGSALWPCRTTIISSTARKNAR